MPKTREVEFIVPGTPEEVAERLKGKTRYRFFPYQTSALGQGGMGGRVTGEGFTVAVDDKEAFQTLQAVAKGRFEAAPGGTKVTARLGLPQWTTWMLRASLLFMPFYLGWVGYLVMQESGLATTAGMLALFLTSAVAVIGWMVHRADESLPKLEKRLAQALDTQVDAAPQTEANAARQGDRKKRAGRRKQGQS